MRGDFIKTLTAVSIILAFDFTVIGLLFIEIPVGNRDIFVHTIGMVDTAFVGFLVAYYYTRSQAKKEPPTDKPSGAN